MSIATRPTWGHPASGSSLDRADPIGTSRPPTELLPPGGNLAPAPAPAPERMLARDALTLIRLLRLRGTEPLSEEALSLIPSVDSIRRQLDPIRTRRSLAASYGREAFHVYPPPPPHDTANAGAVKLAYALRWLELGPD